NGLIASAVLRGGPGKARRAWGAAALAVVVPSALGVARARTLPVSPGPTVGVVGTSVPTELRISPSLAGAEALKQVLSAVGGISAGATDLLVLPEGTVPFPALSQDAAGTLEELRTVARAKGAPVVFGGLGEDQAGGEGVATTNSAFLLSPSGGPHGPVQRYDKVRLVPGMEAGSYRKGGGQVVFVAGEWSYGPLICYESLFGGAARKARSSGAQVLLNLSSDIWFGHQGTLVGSLFLTQHPAHLVLRAIETRTPIVRAANGGFSFLMDPLGRMMSEAKSGAGEVVVGQVPVFVGTTLFARTGDWVGPTCALLCALALLMTGLGVRGRRGPLTDWPPSG
ncbi:MAG: apolipoprotein N-acyltransferase, partial [Gemmatimonadetes bacterium]|nr:apolipoprotein N-acyltransferase [Gemmatimonadota bacterium]